MPSPRESTETRAATPMMMPSVERSVRSGLARSVSKPTRSDAAAMRSNMRMAGKAGNRAFSTYGPCQVRFQRRDRNLGVGNRKPSPPRDEQSARQSPRYQDGGASIPTQPHPLNRATNRSRLYSA